MTVFCCCELGGSSLKLRLCWQCQLIGMFRFTFGLTFFLQLQTFHQVYATVIELEKDVRKSLTLRGKVLFQMWIRSFIPIPGLCWNCCWDDALQQAEGEEERQLCKCQFALLAEELFSQTAHFNVKKRNVLFGKTCFSVKSC